MRLPICVPSLLLILVSSVVSSAAGSPPPPPPADPYPSTYHPRSAPPVLITHATVLTAAGDRIEDGSVLLRDGKIAGVGHDLQAPAGAVIVDAKGKWVTPGLIDAHSHLGVYPSPEVPGNSDGNEVTDPITADMWALHSIWPQDPQFPLALAGGVTSQLILPGSANLMGGRGVTVKTVPGRSAMDMRFPGAPWVLKMACGENPKRVYGAKGRSPATRMGNIAVAREAWIKARDYEKKWDAYRQKLAAGKEASEPDRDLELETLVGVLRGEILVENHCYRADEMLNMIDMAKEFGYKVAAFHHAVEAYKIADVLAENNICAAMWAEGWGFKMEALDGIRENIALVDHAKNGCAVVHSDSAETIQRLNQEAAKAMAAGNKLGFNLRPEDAIRWVTINPAKAIGVDKQTGSLEVGKMADVVLWTGNPFSVYSRTEKVYVDGVLLHDADDPAHAWRTDFELGTVRETPSAPLPQAPPHEGALSPAAAPAADSATGSTGSIIAITGGTVHTLGAAGTLDNATVLIENGRIRAVGKDVAIPAGARRIDAAGKVVTPGLFDSESNLSIADVDSSSGTVDTTVSDDRITAANDILDVINAWSPVIPINRVNGVTRTVVAPSAGKSLLAGRGAVIDLGSESPDFVVRPRVAMFAELGESAAKLSGGSRAGALLRLREALQDALDYGANRAAFERGDRRPYALSRLDLEALQPVVRREIPLVIAVDRATDIEAALRLAKEFQLNLILSDVAEGWMVARKIAEAKVPVLLQINNNLPDSFDRLGATLENAARLHAAGVTLALKSADARNARDLKQAAGNAVAYGLPWQSALEALTTAPARIWGIADHYGTLEPGKDADVVVWDGDPLEVTTTADRVFIRGAEVPMTHRQLELRDRYKGIAQ